MSISTNNKVEVNKDQTNFLHLCKDLFKFIKRKIIKNYICQDFPDSPIPIPNPWSYIHPEEQLTQEDKALNIFKDSTFLPLVQKCYEALENVITRLDENRKKVEIIKINADMDEKKVKLLNDLNSHLNQYFNNGENNSGIANSGKSDKLTEKLNLAKTFNIINDLKNMNSINSFNEIDSKVNNNNDIMTSKNDNITDNNELTGDYSDETKSNDKCTFLGQKRELNFDSILEADKFNIKKSKFENISFQEKLPKESSSKNSTIIINPFKKVQKEQDTLQSESELEKILKQEFSSIYNSQKESLSEQNKDYIQEIKNILRNISSIKFPQNKNKFDNPILVGSHKIFDIKYLLNSIPAIDILFRCREIKNMDEIDLISQETMANKLKLGYIEICKAYDKSSEIIKVINKCKIKTKDNVFFIYINLFFVDVQNSNYMKKERCFSNYLTKNKLYENSDVILICLFFRRWRRKFKLYFIKPEFLDIIVNLYYTHTEKKNIALIIENIFFDLSNNKINYFEMKGNNVFCSFINEWYTISENKNAINNAISVTNELLLKNNYLTLIKTD